MIMTRSSVTIDCLLLMYSVCTSVLWRCWLGGRKGIRPVKTEPWGAGMVISLERGADLHMAQLMPLPLTVSCFSRIQIGFTFLVPAYPGSPGHRAVKWLFVCLYLSAGWQPIMQPRSLPYLHYVTAENCTSQTLHLLGRSAIPLMDPSSVVTLIPKHAKAKLIILGISHSTPVFQTHSPWHEQCQLKTTVFCSLEKSLMEHIERWQLAYPGLAGK